MSFAVRFGSVLQYILMLTSVEYTTFISRFCKQLETKFHWPFQQYLQLFNSLAFLQRHMDRVS